MSEARAEHVLVTGGAGFIGHHLVRALLRAGHAVSVLDDLSTGRAERLPPEARLVRGDVRDRAALAAALEGVGAVAHLAAIVSVRGSNDGFVRDAEVNYLGALQLLAAMAGRSIRRAVLASSMAVYADGAPGQRLSEDHPTRPASPYGISKLAAEQAFHLIGPAAGVESVVLRYFNTYGPGQTPTPYVGVVTHFADRARRGLAPQIFGDGEQARDYVHVDDIVAATLAALSAPDAVGGTFNVGTGDATTVNQVARQVLDHLGAPLTPEHLPPVRGELRHAVADIGRARALLGYRPARSGLDLDSVLGPPATPRTR